MAINDVKERKITRLFVTMEDLADVKRDEVWIHTYDWNVYEQSKRMKDTQRGQIKAQGTIQGRISSHIADEVWHYKNSKTEEGACNEVYTFLAYITKQLPDMAIKLDKMVTTLNAEGKALLTYLPDASPANVTGQCVDEEVVFPVAFIFIIVSDRENLSKSK